ncbi:Alkali-sensitive linkage protein 1 [Golovinomyces cichoracearum]|uniref:Alkali-sensitive linkage protein 1 n=1 Tax=Golovinomyces cichoracearum TaxID=62708 RepID=A0A420IQU9_9PEZI|nr:Alkali-sensitive linkage protein 1 [Golovinomyces cichoracearum]
MRLTRLISATLVTSLVHAAVPGRYDVRKRDTYLVQENVLITEQVKVIQQPDGTKVTGQSEPIATSISDTAPVQVFSAEEQKTPQLPATSPEVSETPTISKPKLDVLGVSDGQNKESAMLQPTSNEAKPVSVSETLEKEKPEDAVSTPNLKPALSQLSEKPNLSLSTSPVASPLKGEQETSLREWNTNEQAAKLSRIPSKAVASKEAKRGIAYNDIAKLSAFTSSSKVSWAYNWGSTTPAIPNNVEFVPMLWGTGSHAAGWKENADKAIASGSTHLLAFNEPDLGEQSSLSVGDAVSGYQNLMQPYAGKAKLGSPAVTNGGSPMGLTYLKNFINACSGCTIDFIAIHWYNGGSADDFKNYVAKAHIVGGGRPVWITEFEGPGDAQQQQKFLKEVLPWLDNQDYVERYAYFMASDGNLISSGTSPSAVGQAYAFDN